MKTETEFTTVSAIVMKLLKEDERCRNDDKWLTYKVMRYFTNIYIPFDDFKKIPAFETIKRCRANIQNTKKLYPPTDKAVIIKRRVRSEVIPKHLNSIGGV